MSVDWQLSEDAMCVAMVCLCSVGTVAGRAGLRLDTSEGEAGHSWSVTLDGVRIATGNASSMLDARVAAEEAAARA